MDEGTIRAQLALDIASFQAQVDAALVQTQRLGAGLEAIPDVTLRLETADLQTQTDAALAQMQRLGDGLTSLPEGQPQLDTTALQPQIDTTLQDVQRLGAGLQDLPAGQPQLDLADLQAQGAAADQIVQQVGAALADLPPGVPTLDVGPLQAEVETSLQDVQRLSKGLQEIPAAKPRIQPPTEDADKVKTLAKEVAEAIGKLSGGRVELDIGQLETAGASAGKILETLRAGLASTAAAATVTAAAVVAAFLEVEHVLVEMGEHWEAAFRKVAATTGLSGEALEQFEASAVNVGRQSPASIEAIGAAMQQLSTRLQLTGADLETATTQATKFAKVWGLDAGDAAKSLAQIMTLFHEPSTRASADFDILTAVAQKTQIPMEQLTEQLKSRLGPSLVALGFNFTESALLLGNMAQQGNAGRAAIQSLNKILQEAAAAGKDPQVVFAELVQQLKEAGAVGTATGDALATKLGPAFPTLSTLAKRGGLDVKEGAQEIQAAGETVNAAFDVMRSGAVKIGDQLTILKNQFAPLGIAIATAVNQMEEQLAGAIGKVTAAVQAFLKAKAEFDAKQAQSATDGTITPFEAAAGFGGGTVPRPAPVPAEHPPASAPEVPPPVASPGGPPVAAATGAYVDLAKAVSQVQKQIDDLTTSGGTQALLQSLLEQKKAIENLTQDVTALPPAEQAAAQAALALAQAHYTEAAALKADSDATAQQAIALNAAGDAAGDQARQLAAQSALLRDQGDAYSQSAAELRKLNQTVADYTQLSDAQLAAALKYTQLAAAEPGLTAARRAALDQQITALQREADARHLVASATDKYAQANQAADASDNQAAEGADRHRQANEAATEAAQKLTAAQLQLGATNTLFSSTAQSAAERAAGLSVEWGRLSSVFAAAKPFLNESQEALLKIAQRSNDVDGALQILQQATGASDAQIAQWRTQLQGSGDDAERAANSVKALHTPLDTLQARLGELATAAYPNLSKAQADALQQTLKAGDATKETAALADAYGVSVDELNKHLADSKAHFDEWTKQVAAAKRPLDDFVNDETKTRIGSALSALTSGTDAVTAAQAKQLVESGHQVEALELLANKYGVGKEQADAWAKAVEQGGGAAQLAAVQIKLATAVTGDLGRSIFEAQEKLQALTQFARDPQNGTIRLKVDVDIDAAQKAIGDLQRSFREASQQRADAEAKATHEFSVQQAATAQQQSKLQSDYASSVADLAKARTDSAQQLGRDLAAASTASNKAVGDISAAGRKAQNDYAKAVGDAQVGLDLAFANAKKTYDDGVKSLAQQAADAIQGAAKAAASGLQTLSNAMSSFNQQQTQNAFTASVAAQNAQLALLPGLNDTSVGGVTNAQRVAALQATGSAALQQTAQEDTLRKAQNAVAQQQLDATKALTKTMDDLAKQVQALDKTQKDAQIAATVTYQNKLVEAGDALGIAQVGEDAYNATTIRTQRVVKINGQSYRILDPTEFTGENQDIQPGGLVGQAKAAADATAHVLGKAFDDERQREKALDDKAAQAQQKEIERLQALGLERAQDPEGKGRTKAEQAFDEAEKARHKADADAARDYQDRLHLLRVQEEIAERLRALPAETAEAIAARVKIGEQNFLAGASITNLETQVDFLATSIGEFARQSRGRG